MSCWPYIDHSQLAARERDDNKAIRSEDEQRKRERKGVTFFDMGIYFRPISGIPRRKYPPRSSADCITRRGMRRTEIEERKKEIRSVCVREEETGNERNGGCRAKGRIREREKEREEERSEDTSARDTLQLDVCLLLLCLLSNDARPWRMRESITFIAALPILAFDGRTRVSEGCSDRIDLGDLRRHIVPGLLLPILLHRLLSCERLIRFSFLLSFKCLFRRSALRDRYGLAIEGSGVAVLRGINKSPLIRSHAIRSDNL